VLQRQARAFDLLELRIVLGIAKIIDVLANAEIVPRSLRRNSLAGSGGLLLRHRRETSDGHCSFGTDEKILDRGRTDDLVARIMIGAGVPDQKAVQNDLG